MKRESNKSFVGYAVATSLGLAVGVPLGAYFWDHHLATKECQREEMQAGFEKDLPKYKDWEAHNDPMASHLTEVWGAYTSSEVPESPMYASRLILHDAAHKGHFARRRAISKCGEDLSQRFE